MIVHRTFCIYRLFLLCVAGSKSSVDCIVPPCVFPRDFSGLCVCVCLFCLLDFDCVSTNCVDFILLLAAFVVIGLDRVFWFGWWFGIHISSTFAGPSLQVDRLQNLARKIYQFLVWQYIQLLQKDGQNIRQRRKRKFSTRQQSRWLFVYCKCQ